MKQRQGDIVMIFVGYAEILNHAQTEQEAVGVGHDHPLGRAGGARGVHDAGRVLRGGEGRVGRLGPPPGLEWPIGAGGFVQLTDDENVLDARRRCAQRLEPVQVVGMDDQQVRLGVVQRVGKEAAHQFGVDHNRHRAQPADAGPGADDVEPVREHDGDAVAGLDVELPQ